MFTHYTTSCIKGLNLLPNWQNFPSKPSLHLHVSGAMQSPPFRHSMLQTAAKYQNTKLHLFQLLTDYYLKSMKYVRKIFPKTNISNPPIRTRTCAYQGVWNVSFSENFTYVSNGWPHILQSDLKTHGIINMEVWDTILNK